MAVLLFSAVFIGWGFLSNACLPLSLWIVEKFFEDSLKNLVLVVSKNFQRYSSCFDNSCYWVFIDANWPRPGL